jgi:hypothetical protein
MARILRDDRDLGPRIADVNDLIRRHPALTRYDVEQV